MEATFAKLRNILKGSSSRDPYIEWQLSRDLSPQVATRLHSELAVKYFLLPSDDERRANDLDALLVDTKQ